MPLPGSPSVDVLIIGSGPVGLYAAYYAGFRGLSVAIVDSLPEPGGQVTALYPEKTIYDVAGIPAIKGKDLVADLLTQLEPFDPTWHLGQRAEALDAGAASVTISTASGLELETKAVVITGGIGTFAPRALPGAERYEGRGLRYFVPRLDELRDRRVLIVGGGDSAFDWALALAPIATSVSLVHRRDSFRAHEHTVGLARQADVEIRTPVEVERIHGDDHVRAADLRDNRTDERLTIEVDEIVAALGFVADLGPVKRWGLNLAGRHIVANTSMATNLPRVFAAGDIVTYPGKVPLISVGFGEAAIAVNNAATVIDPSLLLFPGHSTDATTG